MAPLANVDAEDPGEEAHPREPMGDDIDPPSSQILVSWPSRPGFGESSPLRDVAFEQRGEVLVRRRVGGTRVLE